MKNPKQIFNCFGFFVFQPLASLLKHFPETLK
jgi:hypothetical protein